MKPGNTTGFLSDTPLYNFGEPLHSCFGGKEKEKEKREIEKGRKGNTKTCYQLSNFLYFNPKFT